MTILNPEWVLLVAVFALLGWQVKALELWRPWRVVLCALLVLLLMDLQLERLQRGLDLWVLVDRSASANDAVEAGLVEWESILEKSRGSQDRLFYIDFAGEAGVRAGRESVAIIEDTNSTNIGLAIQRAMLRRDPQRTSKLLLLGDGYGTDSLDTVEQLLLRSGVALSTRLATAPDVLDYSVRALEAPSRALARESYLVEAEVRGPAGSKVPYVLLRNGQAIREGVADLAKGRAKLQFSDRTPGAAAVSYTLAINPEGDAVAGNNRKTAWMQVDGEARALLVTNFAVDPVEQALASQGFALETVREPGRLDAGSLTGTSLVILNNVPASQLPQGFQDGLDFYVREQGGALLMLGGAYSFGSGGYHGSPVGELLPVSMELKEEHKKLAVAMAIVVDRSGSMTASVGGSGGLTKMDLANAGAVQAVRMLGELDALAYVAVDTEAHVMVPLTDIAENREGIIDRINRVASMGGGIYVFVGLEAGWTQLKRSEYGQRHLILFADASDAEEPGAYKALLEEMVNEKTTVSVIAMGSDSDPDAAMLKDVALRGGGRIFFNQNAQDLPALFTQETVAVARSAFIEENLDTLPTAGWLEISSKPVQWLPQIGGYNLSYLKEGATMALASGDEYQAPLVAFWQQGVGRAAAVTFPMSGNFSVLSVNWGGYGDFLQTLCRWLAGDPQIDGLSYESRLDGDQLTLDLYYDERWNERFGQTPPRAVLSRDDAAAELVWNRIEPGRYQATQRVARSALVRGAIGLGDKAIPFGPFMVAEDEEWQRDRAKLDRLRSLVKASGGEPLSNLADAWAAPPQRQNSGLRRWLLGAFLLVLLADIAETRLGIRILGFVTRVVRSRS